MKILRIDYSIKLSLINCTIDSHPNRDDIFELDTTKLKRIQALEKRGVISGHKYLERLKKSGKPLLDVRVMEELLKPENQHLIPEGWKKGWTHFFGTIFRGPCGNLYVPGLRWGGGGWYWYYRWLSDGLLHDAYAASLAIDTFSAAQ